MRLRPYIADRDYAYLKNWITDERVHALWCANLIPYPVSSQALNDVLEKNALDWKGSAYVAIADCGEPVGFFCYSLNEENNAGFLKFVIVSDKLRGRGYSREMLKLALKYAHEMTGAESVKLNVFDVNVAAKRCYESVGFVERSVVKDAFSFRDEKWGRCTMEKKCDLLRGRNIEKKQTIL